MIKKTQELGRVLVESMFPAFEESMWFHKLHEGVVVLVPSPLNESSTSTELINSSLLGKSSLLFTSYYEPTGISKGISDFYRIHVVVEITNSSKVKALNKLCLDELNFEFYDYSKIGLVSLDNKEVLNRFQWVKEHKASTLITSDNAKPTLRLVLEFSAARVFNPEELLCKPKLIVIISCEKKVIRVDSLEETNSLSELKMYHRRTTCR